MEKEGVVIIGGSAGSIDVLLNLLPYIPVDFRFPIVIILHRKNTAEYHLEDVLSKKCKLAVYEIFDKMQLEANNIYLVPGDYHLLVDSSGCLCLDYSEKLNFSRPSIDVAFDSFAKAYDENLVGILLSGANADGAAGLNRIKKAQGITIVQTPESAKVPTMPVAAINLFKPDAIVDVMKMIGFFSELNELGIAVFKKKLRKGEEIETNLPSVLIVDDINENLIALSALLKTEELIIHKASSGKAAIEMAQKNVYDCIILDVQMPEMNGFEVAAALGEMAEAKNTPILFLSALGSDKEKVIRGIDSGAIDFIAKPPDPELLKAKVKLCINISRKAKQSNKVFNNVQKERDSFRNHNADVAASLKYARNIQQALLPREQFFNSVFKDNFILYQPKDSIGGDFYTLKEQNDKTVLICGDCTGHGVPGAMMTMISLNIIHNLIESKGITQPDKILDGLSAEFRLAFRSEFSSLTIDDGLELAVCTFSKNENKVQFASSRRPALFLRGSTMEKIDADYLGISASMPEDFTFTLKEFDLQAGDQMYFFTDGVVDQFGGKQGKKFMLKRLVEAIQNCAQQPLAEQKAYLDKTIQDWKGEENQIDDILLMGIRLS